MLHSLPAHTGTRKHKKEKRMQSLIPNFWVLCNLRLQSEQMGPENLTISDFQKGKVFESSITFSFFCHTMWQACGISGPQPGIKPRSSALEGGFLATGPPGKSWGYFIVNVRGETPSCPLLLWLMLTLSLLAPPFQQNLNTEHRSLTSLTMLFPKEKILFSLYFPNKNSTHNVKT